MITGKLWKAYIWKYCFLSLKNHYLFTYLAALGLGCGTWDLCYVMQIFHYRYGASRCGMRTSVVAAHGLSSCGAWVQLLWPFQELQPVQLVAVACGIFITWIGIEPTSPALQSGFLTTGPQESLGSIVFIFRLVGKYRNFRQLIDSFY